MPALRIVPPRLFARLRAPLATDDLTAFYFAQLWRHCRRRDRAVGAILALCDAVANVGAFAAGAGAWSHGWDTQAQAMVADANAAAFLGMRARKGINRLLNPAAFPLAANPLKNKHLFARLFRESGLPTPQVFAGRAEAMGNWIGARRALMGLSQVTGQ